MKRLLLTGATFLAILPASLPPLAARASPFGQGVFGADVPFGSATSISIALGGDVSLPLSWDGSAFTGTGGAYCYRHLH